MTDDPRPDIGAVFRSGFASIGKAISLAPDWDAKRAAWRNGLHEALIYWHGIERRDIVDECYQIADAKDLVKHYGADAIQQDIVEEIQRADSKAMARIIARPSRTLPIRNRR